MVTEPVELLLSRPADRRHAVEVGRRGRARRHMVRSSFGTCSAGTEQDEVHARDVAAANEDEQRQAGIRRERHPLVREGDVAPGSAPGRVVVSNAG